MFGMDESQKLAGSKNDGKSVEVPVDVTTHVVDGPQLMRTMEDQLNQTQIHPTG